MTDALLFIPSFDESQEPDPQYSPYTDAQLNAPLAGEDSEDQALAA